MKNDNEVMTIYLLLRRMRRMSQSDVADKVGISNSQLYKIEKGFAKVKPELNNKFAETFKVMPEIFAKFDPSIYRPIIRY